MWLVLLFVYKNINLLNIILDILHLLNINCGMFAMHRLFLLTPQKNNTKSEWAPMRGVEIHTTVYWSLRYRVYRTKYCNIGIRPIVMNCRMLECVIWSERTAVKWKTITWHQLTKVFGQYSIIPYCPVIVWDCFYEVNYVPVH